jgi:uroporphyrinogen-III synthase
MGVREWIVTRPAGEAADLVDSLASAGIAARAIPCVERHFLDWPWPPPRHEPGWVLVTSAAMAERLGPIPDYIRVAALAPKTAKVLTAKGIEVSLEAEGGVQHLADALELEWSKEKRPKWFIHYPTSDLGLKEHEQTMAVQVLERIATLRRYEAYRSVAPRELVTQAKTVGPETGLIFYSPSAISHWIEVSQMKPAAVLCHGKSTLEWYEHKRPVDWPHGVLATGEIPRTVVEMDRSAQ